MENAQFRKFFSRETIQEIFKGESQISLASKIAVINGVCFRTDDKFAINDEIARILSVSFGEHYIAIKFSQIQPSETEPGVRLRVKRTMYFPIDGIYELELNTPD